MSTNNLHPSDLREALSVTPLLHLIPKQDIAPLISSASIDTIPDDVDIVDKNPKSIVNQMRTALNNDPKYFKEVVDFLAEDFEGFEDGELDDLVFKKPVLSHNDQMAVNDRIDLPPFEKRLFDGTNDIEESSIKELKIQFDPSEFDGSRLSVRKKYNLDDQNSIRNHNNVYQKKFQKEYNIMLMNRQHANMRPISASNDSNKRSLDSSTKNDTPEPKRLQKSTYLDHNVLVKKACDELVSFITQIGLVDDVITDDRYWITKNDTKLLTAHSLVTILDRLLRIINDPIIETIDIEYLLKVQSLCFKSVSEGVEMNWNELINLIDTSSESNFTNNLPEIKLIFDHSFNYLIAAKIMTLFLNGRRSDKKLFLDEYLKAIIDLVYSLVQDAVVPFANKSITNINIINSLKTTYSALSSDIGLILNSISSHIQGNDVDEEILTRLEYLSILVIFADGNIKEKLSLLGVNNFESLRINSCDILISIFKNHPDQRQFILNEILSNFDKLPPQKLAARQFRLVRGGNVQLVTVLLMYILQSFDIHNISEEASEAKSVLVIDENSLITIQSKRRSFLENSNALLQQAVQISNDIASFLIAKLTNNPDQQQKHSIELLLEDILVILPFPEWPGAELLLISLMKTLLLLIQNGNCTAIVETYALELAGMIGVKILNLKKKVDSIHQLKIKSSPDDIIFFKECFIDTLEYVQVQMNKNRAYIPSFRFLTLKYVCILRTILLEATKQDQENQLASLNSDPDNVPQVSSVSENVNEVYDSLLNIIAEDSIKLNQALNSNKDSSSINSYVNILLPQNLLSLYDNFLSMIIKSLDSNKIKSKTRAIKILSSLIDKDPILLISPRVQESISSRLLDSSPLVRDAVIDLISRYMNSKPDVIDQFHKPICDRLNDDSVQVRKRVIKLAKEMYLNSDKRTVKGQISMMILRRLDDEDDVIQNLAKSYLIELWFTSLITEINDKELASVASSTLKRSEVMMDIVGSGGKNAKYFELFFNDYVLSSKDIIVHEAVKLNIEKTLDFIIDCADTKFQPQVERALKLISMFVKCDGKLMTQDQLVALQPYIIDEKNSGEAVCFYSLQILKNVLPEFNSLRPDFIETIQSYLLRRLTRFNVRELHEAMPCVWRLCQMKSNTVKLANASISCMNLIKPYIDQSKKKVGMKPDAKLHKLLHLLGCFGTYCKFEKHRDIFLRSLIGLKENETVISVITKFLLYFCGPKFDGSVRNSAIKCIIYVCAAHPKLLMSEAILKVLDREFDGSDLAIKHSMISGIMDFLNKEDSDAQRRNGAHAKSSKDTKLDVAAFHGDAQIYVNDGICAGIIQRYIGPILSLCLYDGGNFSFLPVQFLQLVVNLGFANPKLCIPTIIALESSTNPYIKTAASELHRELYDKHESLTETSYLEGIKLAIKYRKNTSDNFYQERFFIDSLYSIVRGNYSSRKKLVQSLTKLFTVSIDNQSLENNIFQRDIIVYTSFNIASINFSSLEEVLIIIHNLDKVILRDGMDLSDKLKEKNSSLSLLHYQNLCINSQTLIAIITLRNYLLSTYCITSSHIENFRPNKVDIELRQPPKVVHLVPFSLDNVELSVDLQKSDGFEVVFSRFFQAVNDFTQSHI